MNNRKHSFIITASIVVAVPLALLLVLIVVYVPMLVISLVSEQHYYAGQAHAWGTLIGIMGVILSVLLGGLLMRIIWLNSSIMRCRKENRPEDERLQVRKLKKLLTVLAIIPALILVWSSAVLIASFY